ncbi:MAG: FKBP-type peptidyl-prolyl cis-trans isomerase [Bacteroidota bacterium]|nr:FKBP-type peptidyl-prolyl cis-trans isomerase [Bacteroidota bacterium]
MKKIIAFVFAGILIAGGCIKDSHPAVTCSPVTATAPTSEVTLLKAFLDSSHITATGDSRGFFYTIDSSAAVSMAGHPTICSDVSVTYTGTFLNGQAFDSSGANTPISLSLSSTVLGWQEAVPFMRSNAVMTLYLPPSLAYGAGGRGPIPPNANLIFTIKLLAYN